MKADWVVLRVTVNDESVTCITFEETKLRTKHMIARDKGLDFNDISLFHNLSKDLSYSRRDKRDLKTPIDSIFFVDVNANADHDDLDNAATVRDLAGRIYTKYIPEKHRC